jgi:hypothetical protein
MRISEFVSGYGLKPTTKFQHMSAIAFFTVSDCSSWNNEMVSLFERYSNRSIIQISDTYYRPEYRKGEAV